MLTIPDCDLLKFLKRYLECSDQEFDSNGRNFRQLKDAQCAETNGKQFFDFYFSSYRENSSKIYNF